LPICEVDAGHRLESAAIGSILAFSLGLGFLFVRLYGGSAQGIYAFLFGAILGITDRDVQLTFTVALVTIALLAAIGRPLMFASVDPDVAQARGVPVRMLSLAFLLILALSVAITVQIVGTLLIFALLVAPPPSAPHLPASKGRGTPLTAPRPLASTWLAFARASLPTVPVAFFPS